MAGVRAVVAAGVREWVEGALRQRATPLTRVIPSVTRSSASTSKIASDTITVTEPAREIAKVILDAPLPRPMQLFGPAHRLATSTLLPRRLQHEYGLRCSSLHRLTPAARRALAQTHCLGNPARRLQARAT